MAVACTASRPAAPVALPLGADAVVTSDAFLIAFPVIAPGDTIWRASAWDRVPRYYEWRFGARTTPTVSVEIQSSGEQTAHAPERLAAALSTSELRRCRSGGHVLTCAETLAGDARVAVRDGGGQYVEITVRDRGVVAAYRTSRPAYVLRTVRSADGSMMHDSIRVAYRDP